MPISSIETTAFDQDIKLYYESKQFARMQDYIMDLMQDSFDAGRELVLANKTRFSRVEDFLDFLKENYPAFNKYLHPISASKVDS